MSPFIWMGERWTSAWKCCTNSWSCLIVSSLCSAYLSSVSSLVRAPLACPEELVFSAHCRAPVPEHPTALWKGSSFVIASSAWQASAAAQSLVALVSSSSARLSGTQTISPPGRHMEVWRQDDPDPELVVASEKPACWQFFNALADDDFICHCCRRFWPSFSSILFDLSALLSHG